MLRICRIYLQTTVLSAKTLETTFKPFALTRRLKMFNEQHMAMAPSPVRPALRLLERPVRPAPAHLGQPEARGDWLARLTRWVGRHTRAR
jgi:hypothetical protein